MAATADPLWEILLSLHMLQTSAGGLAGNAWRRQVRAHIQRDRKSLHAVRSLASLAPVASYIPDFLTPAEASKGIDAGIDAMLTTPRHRLKTELTRLAAVSTPPPQAADLAGGDTTALRNLAGALRTYHAAALTPYRDQLQTHIQADHAARTQTLAGHGAEPMLTGFDAIRWTPPVLEVTYPVDRDLHLDGRGLLLTPSLFCWRTPIALADPTLPPVLVYPANRPVDWITTTGPQASTHQRMSALLGTTRATILENLGGRESAVTGQLARLTATTPATVSKHTTVLRDSGLITSSHSGRYVIHRLTPLGAALLNGHEKSTTQ